MNHKLCSLLIATAVLVGANALSAQILLDDFSSFASPNTLFFGDWSLSGDPFSGDPAATATFSQGVGFYNFASGSDADSSYVERTFGSVRNLSGQNFLMVSSRLLPGNTADSFTVFLVDAGANTAFAVFATSDFNAAGFNTGSAALTADIG